jgi:uncharacterized membrane protein
VAQYCDLRRHVAYFLCASNCGVSDNDAVTKLALSSTRQRDALPVRHIPPHRVWHWLALGLADLRAAPMASLIQGLAVTVGGWMVVVIARYYWWLAPGAISGFLLVGPILCTGFYELSRLRARGERPGLPAVVNAWRRDSGPLVRLGLLLLLLGSLWVLLSALLFWLFVPTPIRSPWEFLLYAAVDQGNLLFALWAIVGGLGAAVVFALAAVSPPLLLGRMVGFRQALLTSARAVGENPVTMALWASLILGAIILSFATAMLGFLVAVPLIGHATWHAYKDLVVTDGVPLRYE